MKGRPCIQALVTALAYFVVAAAPALAATQAPFPEKAPAPPAYSAARLYNEGNADAKAGRQALAVLSYERARLLAPWDPDIRANLRTVRERAGVPAPSGHWFAQHVRLAAPNTMYWWGFLGLVLLGGGLILRRAAPPARRTLAAGLAATGFVMTGLTACDVFATLPLLHESVVMTSAPARAAPTSGSDPLFTLMAADVVENEDKHQGFILVKSATGREGWVARDELTPIIPPGSGAALKPT